MSTQPTGTAQTTQTIPKTVLHTNPTSAFQPNTNHTPRASPNESLSRRSPSPPRLRSVRQPPHIHLQTNPPQHLRNISLHSRHLLHHARLQHIPHRRAPGSHLIHIRNWPGPHGDRTTQRILRPADRVHSVWANFHALYTRRRVFQLVWQSGDLSIPGGVDGESCARGGRGDEC